MTVDATPADGPRAAVMRQIAGRLAGHDPGHPLRVGIDGVCGVGKSTFADELASALASEGRAVVLLDSDGFHHIRARRYRQGRDSARGYYDDAYDFGALADQVLRPLGPGGGLIYAAKVHDLATDAVVTEATAKAAPDAVVLLAATFIQRGDLRALWDEVVYLDATEEAALARGIARDASALGGAAAARTAYDARYMEACRIYLREEQPLTKASIVVEHTDPAAPVLIRW
ncbi:MAG TPA: hypothetical protein VHC43_05645 [Mycobacteriales bacterium]|nr:hypothetical protein [Mycobacteriales bacterium]